MTTTRSPPAFTEPVAPEVLAETRAFNTNLERLIATQPSLDRVPLARARQCGD